MAMEKTSTRPWGQMSGTHIHVTIFHLLFFAIAATNASSLA